jgi:hypothetical protein
VNRRAFKGGCRVSRAEARNQTWHRHHNLRRRDGYNDWPGITYMTQPTMTVSVTERAKAVGRIASEHADWGDEHGRLAEPVVEALHNEGLFGMWVPRTLGGAELNPVSWPQRSRSELARRTWTMPRSSSCFLAASGCP